MVTSAMTEKARRDGCDYYSIAWAGPCLIEAAIQIDEFTADLPPAPSDQELYRFAVFNIAQEIASLHPGAQVFRDVDGRVLTLLSGGDAEELQERAMQTAESIHHSVASFLPLRIAAGIGHVVRWGDDVPSLHQTALTALDYRFAAGSHAVIRLADMERRHRPGLLSAVSWENELITRLKTGTAGEMDEWVEGLFASFREHLYPAAICHIYLQRIALTLLHTLYELCGEEADAFNDAENPITDMSRFTKWEEAEAWTKELCARAMDMIRRTREDLNALQVEKAIEYVRRHYADPELSLTALCKHISMSVSYFSTLFKQYTGSTFVEFVTRERMDKAKELLKLSGMKNYEIAYAVGYSDPHYFSGAFKKHEGDTPTEFRRQALKDKA